MWKHEVINCFNESGLALRKGDIHTAPCFYLGDLGAYGDMPLSPDCDALPYDEFVVEFLTRGGNPEVRAEKRAFYIRRLPSRVSILMFFTYHETHEWGIYPIQVTIDRETTMVGRSPLSDDAEWQEEYRRVKRLMATKDFLLLAKIPFLLSALLSCKNVTPQPVDPPEALNKKRLKRGKGPLYRYHILTVDPNKGRSLAGKSSGKNLGTMPVHLCRGHFKEYTEERPLFGRVTGRFWWQPFARGEARNGIVTKDYKIKEPEARLGVYP